MTAIGEAALATSIILEIVKMCQDKGIDINLDNLEEQIANMNARWKKAKGQLKE